MSTTPSARRTSHRLEHLEGPPEHRAQVGPSMRVSSLAHRDGVEVLHPEHPAPAGDQAPRPTTALARSGSLQETKTSGVDLAHQADEPHGRRRSPGTGACGTGTSGTVGHRPDLLELERGRVARLVVERAVAAGVAAAACCGRPRGHGPRALRLSWAWNGWPEKSWSRIRRPAVSSAGPGSRTCCLDPGVGGAQAVLERDRRLPAHELLDQRVVAVAAADALRSGEVVAAARRRCPAISETMSTRLLMLTSSLLPMLIGSTMSLPVSLQGALDAVVDVHERAGLLAVAPDLDLVVAAEAWPRRPCGRWRPAPSRDRPSHVPSGP